MPSLTDDALQAREQQVFAVLRELLPRLGPQGLTMDKVAAKVDFSKGTLYNHFRSVEDLFGSWVSLVVSSLVFGLIHLLNPAGTIEGAIYISIEAGLLLAAAYLVPAGCG